MCHSKSPDSLPGWVDVSVSMQLFSTTVSTLILTKQPNSHVPLNRQSRPDTPNLHPSLGFGSPSPFRSWSRTNRLLCCEAWGGLYWVSSRAKPISGMTYTISETPGGGDTVGAIPCHLHSLKVISNSMCSCCSPSVHTYTKGQQTSQVTCQQLKIISLLLPHPASVRHKKGANTKVYVSNNTPHGVLLYKNI